eukprot:CAMPEP_0197080930 /NCGR_PEP_ID=MMETSP1384-20130603/214375_1 /TAXON_ID=29189 /ORGANISM="Ammonia sp." /LENGTH=949 /DNA_ID=CAMNT_0042519821 /DNA_START=24 /DNA_END=2874 /DNA_ORIENTATION=+
MITLRRHEISANIDNRYADVVYLFDFENRGQSGSSELKFELTINPNAFISRFEANIDGEIFVGQTKEKEKAAKEYTAAKQKNENAILISQPHKDIPNVFQIKTNVDAKSKTILTITIQQYLQKKFNFNELSVEILRKFSWGYGIRPSFNAIQLALLVNDESGIYDVQIPNGDEVNIQKNETSKDGKSCQIEAQIASTSNINEFRLRYKVKGEAQESRLLFDANSNTFCHIISDVLCKANIADNTDEAKQPNEGGDDGQCTYLIPRCVVFVLDRSGSMHGGKWEKCVSSTIMAIKQLRAGIDKFRVILFDDKLEIVPDDNATAGCVIADESNINSTIQLLSTKRTGDCTDINIALLKAIEFIKCEHSKPSKSDHEVYMNQIILVTDGEPNVGVSDTKQITLNVQKANRLKGDKNNKIGIFSFGVGREGNDSSWVSDLNHSFLKVLSINNNGFYYRIKQTTADSALSEYFSILANPILSQQNNNGFYYRIKQTTADSALSEYFSILANPILSQIQVEYPNKNVSELTPTKFNVLYNGNDLIVCGKMKGIDKLKGDDHYNLQLTISATTGLWASTAKKVKAVSINKTMSVRVPMKQTEVEESDIKHSNNAERIWAYLTLQEFARKELMFNDMIEFDDDEKIEQAKEPYSLAMKYKFVTPWTSMIVVKKKDGDKEESKENEEEPAQQQPIRQSARLAPQSTANYSIVMNSHAQRHSHHMMMNSVQCASPARARARSYHASPAIRSSFSDPISRSSTAAQYQSNSYMPFAHSVRARCNQSMHSNNSNSNRNAPRRHSSLSSAPQQQQHLHHASGAFGFSRQPPRVATMSSAMHHVSYPSHAGHALSAFSVNMSLKDCSVSQVVDIIMHEVLNDAKCALYAYRDLIFKYVKDNGVDGKMFVVLAKADNNKRLFNELKAFIAAKDDKLDGALQQFIDAVLSVNVQQRFGVPIIPDI